MISKEIQGRCGNGMAAGQREGTALAFWHVKVDLDVGPQVHNNELWLIYWHT